jgi:hypothetical protein
MVGGLGLSNLIELDANIAEQVAGCEAFGMSLAKRVLDKASFAVSILIVKVLIENGLDLSIFISRHAWQGGTDLLIAARQGLQH